MLYLLDANILIGASQLYYPMSRIPEFWEWLSHCGTEGRVKIPLDIYEECKDGKDELGAWARQSDIKEALLLDVEADVALVSRVMDEGYAPNLTDDEIEKVGRDPFLIAHALAAPKNRCVVTNEVSKPKRQRANRHVPDVCKTFGVECINLFKFIERLDFRTGWKKR